jgi:hypothetical protein
VMFTSHGSRRWVLEHERVNWDKVEADLKEIFRLIKSPKRLLIGTYKAVSDALKTTHKHLLQGRDVALTHYEVVRGRDDWRDRDAFVSLYDPRVPSKSFTESTDSAARALEQFHGRARDPQPRPKPAEHYHFGTVAPRTWWLDKEHGVGDGRAHVQVRPLGRPPTPMTEQGIRALEALVAAQGSRAKACVALGISASSLSRYLAGKVGVPPAVIQRLDTALSAA